MLEKDLIKLKGTGDGVKIYLDEHSPISDITSSLYEKLRQFRKFFGDGHCNIYFAGRALGASDKMRLEAIVKAMLPESTINYGERKKMSENMEQTLELPKDMEEDTPEAEDTSDMEELKRFYDSNFKSSRARFYEGSVGSGKVVRSDGHLVLVGDVEEGGQVIATGNIIITGSLKGSAQAGILGNSSAYIIAFDFASADIKISTEKHVYIEKSDFKGGAKKAYLSDGRIVCENLISQNS